MSVQVLFGAGAHGVLVAVARVEQVAHIAATVRRRALNLNYFGLLGIGLEDRARSEAALLQIGLYPGHRIIRLRAHRFLHHHLQHQVGAALEVKTKMNAVGQRRLPGIEANSLRNPEDAVDEDEKNRKDQDCFAE